MVALNRAVMLALDPADYPALRGAVQTLEPGRKHPANPVLRPRPGRWDATRCKVYGTVLFDDEADVFRMWYSGGSDHPDAVRRQDGSSRHIGYAVSRDGIEWERPSLGLVEHQDSTDNNLVHLDAQAPNVFRLSGEDPGRRYLLITESGLHTEHVKLLCSADGLRWRREERDAMSGRAGGRYHEPFSILHDPLDPDPSRRWKGYSLLHLFDNGYRGRAVGFFTAAEPGAWVEWPTQPILSAATGVESEIHLPHVSRLHDTYVMLYDAMEPNHHTQTEVAVSRDGVHFKRVQPGVKLLANGEPGEIDAGKVCVSPRSLFTHGGKLWWYYTVSPDTYQTGPRGFRATPWYRYVALAQWREDGMASLRAVRAGETAEARTRPLRSAGGPVEVWLNALAQPGPGGVTIEIVLDGQAAARGRPVVGDGLRMPVEWEEGPAVLAPGRSFALVLRFAGVETRVFAVGVQGAAVADAEGAAEDKKGAALGLTQQPAPTTARPPPTAGLDRRWTFGAAGKITSSPVIGGDALYVTSWDQHLYALDRATGQERWRLPTGNAITTTPAIHNAAVFTVSRDGHLYAADAPDGRLRYKSAVSNGRSAGSISGGWVDCSPTVAPWTPRWGNEPEPPHRLFVGCHNRDMHAFELADGAHVWAFPTANWILSQPAVDYYTIYFGSLDGYVYALDARGGWLKWRFRAGRRLRYHPAVVPGSVACEGVCGRPLVVGSTVYIGGDDGVLYALDAGSGRQRWAYRAGRWVWGRPALIDGMLIVGSADGRVHGLYAATGKPYWSVATGNANYADMVAWRGLALVACTDGHLYAIEARRGHVAWRIDVGAPLRAAPAVAEDGTIYVGTCAGEVHALAPA